MRKTCSTHDINYMLVLKHGFTFVDLYDHDGLKRLDHAFLEYILNDEPSLYQQLNMARTTPLGAKESSQLIIKLAPLVEAFLSDLFDIDNEVTALRSQHHKLAPLFTCKRLFVQRQAAKAYTIEQLANMDDQIKEAEKTLCTGGLEITDELIFAQQVALWQQENNQQMLEAAKLYAAWAVHHEEGKRRHKSGILFKVPHKLNSEQLLDVAYTQNNISSKPEDIIPRHGFTHTDPGISLAQALDNANYCIFCHNQSKDSCSHGMRDKNTGSYVENSLHIKLTGCPLDEKISEMNTLKSEGWIIAALAVVAIDNPMVAATGHRICNDCMKACIYQKQEPVDIPMVESRVLSDVLHLPWGFEIYSLLTRWNPLNFACPLPHAPQPHKVLVAGLGPAGFTLAHYLLQHGYTVAAIDGLKIEPLAADISGIYQDGMRIPFAPIQDITTLFSSLDTRKAYGFGGVAEYGITVRWDKNYLTIIRLLLERRTNFRMYGGVRFGSNITYDKALALGFDHIALALGAGRPKLPPIPNVLARGVRTASDFLMALQLTGAARHDSIASLQIRLPVVVIGGGLTAIDAATESLAYYMVQVEKYLKRYEALGEAIMQGLNYKEREIAHEFIEHAKQLRTANSKQRLELLQGWGGVKVVYRKRLQDAPSYRLNHEELQKALTEGIVFVENIDPKSIAIDAEGDCIGLEYTDGLIPAHTILIAAGTLPNTVLAREDAKHFHSIGAYFTAYDLDGTQQEPQRSAKPDVPYMLTAIAADGRSASFWGDLHPSYAGNVVKAMASAKQGHPVVCSALSTMEPHNTMPAKEFFQAMDEGLLATVHKVKELAPDIIEVVVHAKFAAQEFKPGQFFRMQNYEANALKKRDTVLAMEGLALTGATVDIEQGLISLVVLMMGGSSNLCAYLKPGEQVILMGPTGSPTHIPQNETVMLIGGGLGNAVLLSIGAAMRASGCRVLYFAGYRHLHDRYKLTEIEAAADIVVWCCDEKAPPARRSCDLSFHGNIVEAIEAYNAGKLGNIPISLGDVHRIMVIGSDKMMAAVVKARYESFGDVFTPNTKVIASINSPMQCMMKEICAQCLQRHVDPITGAESYVYSCYNQDQDASSVDFCHLHLRLTQNNIQEKATAVWLDSVG